MKVKLTIAARMNLLKFLPEQQGNMARLLMIRKFREEMSLSDEEWVLTEAKQLENGMLQFNPTKDPMKECELSKITLEAIVLRMKSLEKSENLLESQIDIYERFTKLWDAEKEKEKAEESK